MRYVKTVHVDAAPSDVWAVLADVGAWPSWTPTVSAVVVPSGPLAVGTPVTVTQPGRRATTYTVQAYEPGRSFRWGSESGGVRQWADHVVSGTSSGSDVALTFAMEGPVGALLGLLASRTIRRMVDTEAKSLAKRAGPV